MSIDKINIFQLGGDVTDDTQDPLYPEYLELVKRYEAFEDMPAIPGGYPDAPSFAKFKKQKEREQAIQTMTGALDEGDVKKAYEEGFTQLPIGEQLLHYINPITGVPIETYETGYFTKKGGLEVKSPQEILLDVVNPNKNIAQKTFLKADDPLSAAIAPLSALGALGGIFELANIPKAALIGISRRMNQRAMDGGGGGGGISDLPKPQQETTKDLAGYKSNVYEEAKAVSNELKPEALLKYLKSNKRTNPENNKLRIGLKQTEIDEIDFDAFEAQYPNKDFTNEELLRYINDNRIQLYRVPRSQSPTYRGGDGDDSVEFYQDEPMTYELRVDAQNNYDSQYRDFITRQIDFFDEHFPEGVINKQNYDAFQQRQRDFIQRRDIDTSGQAPSQLVNEFLVKSEFNPYLELGQDQFEFISPDGTLIPDLPSETKQVLGELTEYEGLEYLLEQGYSLKPQILAEDLRSFNNVAEQAAEQRVERDYEDGYGNEVYRYEGMDVYEIIGNEQSGYNITVNGEYDDTAFGEFIPLDEARIQIEQREINEGNITGFGNFDDYNSEDDLIDVLPTDVIEEGATIPNQYERMDTFRLPDGGADDYEEYTIHIKNPKTITRYSRQKGNKHYGGGDELFHIRTTIRTDENGKKVLFVEEIQSDLHSTARSTQTDATYELPPQERQKVAQKIDKLVGDTETPFVYLRDDNTIRISDMNSTTNIDVNELINAGDRFLDREGFVGAGAGERFRKFVEYNGRDKMLELLKIIEPFRNTGSLPDFPYKKDWVDLAVKEAMKIGAEKNVDRVAFTNAATQINRNNKRLDYVQDKVITEVPTEKEILDSVEFADEVLKAEGIAYNDFMLDPNSLVSNFKRVTGQESRFLDMPIPTKNEFFADMPNKRKRMKVLETQEKNITNEMYQKLDDDLTRFMQEYPEVSKEFIEGELDGKATGILNAYAKMSEAELTELARRASVDLDIRTDPRYIDITNPALARLLDADANFREFPQFITDKLGEIRYVVDEKNYLNQFLEHDPLKIREGVLEQLTEKYGVGTHKYKLQDVGYRLEGDEILNPQKIELVGDDYDTQRINTRMLTNDEELLAELPENLREQVKKDLAAGKKEITLNINNTEGSGKKFEEIYKNEIPRGINKALKDLKVKDGGPNTNISGILYADDPIDPEQLLYDFRTLLEGSDDKDAIIDLALDRGFAGIKLHKAIGIDLTDEMKRKILQDGLNNMYMGGKVSKSNSMDRPIAGNVREM